jgi:acylaminoacyl-peptidase
MGYGKNLMESLLGNIGSNDVEDCGELTLLAMDKFKELVDPEKVVCYGWSFGGFLTASLSSH